MFAFLDWLIVFLINYFLSALIKLLRGGALQRTNVQSSLRNWSVTLGPYLELDADTINGVLSNSKAPVRVRRGRLASIEFSLKRWKFNILIRGPEFRVCMHWDVPADDAALREFQADYLFHDLAVRCARWRFFEDALFPNLNAPEVFLSVDNYSTATWSTRLGWIVRAPFNALRILVLKLTAVQVEDCSFVLEDGPVPPGYRFTPGYGFRIAVNFDSFHTRSARKHDANLARAPGLQPFIRRKVELRGLQLEFDPGDSARPPRPCDGSREPNYDDLPENPGPTASSLSERQTANPAFQRVQAESAGREQSPLHTQVERARLREILAIRAVDLDYVLGAEGLSMRHLALFSTDAVSIDLRDVDFASGLAAILRIPVHFRDRSALGAAIQLESTPQALSSVAGSLESSREWDKHASLYSRAVAARQKTGRLRDLATLEQKVPFDQALLMRNENEDAHLKILCTRAGIGSAREVNAKVAELSDRFTRLMKSSYMVAGDAYGPIVSEIPPEALQVGMTLMFDLGDVDVKLRSFNGTHADGDVRMLSSIASPRIEVFNSRSLDVLVVRFAVGDFSVRKPNGDSVIATETAVEQPLRDFLSMRFGKGGLLSLKRQAVAVDMDRFRVEATPEDIGFIINCFVPVQDARQWAFKKRALKTIAVARRRVSNTYRALFPFVCAEGAVMPYVLFRPVRATIAGKAPLRVTFDSLTIRCKNPPDALTINDEDIFSPSPVEVPIDFSFARDPSPLAPANDEDAEYKANVRYRDDGTEQVSSMELCAQNVGVSCFLADSQPAAYHSILEDAYVRSQFVYIGTAFSAPFRSDAFVEASLGSPNSIPVAAIPPTIAGTVGVLTPILAFVRHLWESASAPRSATEQELADRVELLSYDGLRLLRAPSDAYIRRCLRKLVTDVHVMLTYPRLTIRDEVVSSLGGGLFSLEILPNGGEDFGRVSIRSVACTSLSSILHAAIGNIDVKVSVQRPMTADSTFALRIENCAVNEQFVGIAWPRDATHTPVYDVKRELGISTAIVGLSGRSRKAVSCTQAVVNSITCGLSDSGSDSEETISSSAPAQSMWGASALQETLDSRHPSHLEEQSVLIIAPRWMNVNAEVAVDRGSKVKAMERAEKNHFTLKYVTEASKPWFRLCIAGDPTMFLVESNETRRGHSLVVVAEEVGAESEWRFIGSDITHVSLQNRRSGRFLGVVQSDRACVTSTRMSFFRISLASLGVPHEVASGSRRNVHRTSMSVPMLKISYHGDESVLQEEWWDARGLIEFSAENALLWHTEHFDNDDTAFVTTEARGTAQLEFVSVTSTEAALPVVSPWTVYGSLAYERAREEAEDGKPDKTFLLHTSPLETSVSSEFLLRAMAIVTADGVLADEDGLGYFFLRNCLCTDVSFEVVGEGESGGYAKPGEIVPFYLSRTSVAASSTDIAPVASEHSLHDGTNERRLKIELPGCSALEVGFDEEGSCQVRVERLDSPGSFRTFFVTVGQDQIRGTLLVRLHSLVSVRNHTTMPLALRGQRHGSSRLMTVRAAPVSKDDEQFDTGVDWWGDVNRVSFHSETALGWASSALFERSEIIAQRARGRVVRCRQDRPMQAMGAVVRASIGLESAPVRHGPVSLVVLVRRADSSDRLVVHVSPFITMVNELPYNVGLLLEDGNSTSWLDRVRGVGMGSKAQVEELWTTRGYHVVAGRVAPRSAVSVCSSTPSAAYRFYFSTDPPVGGAWEDCVLGDRWNHRHVAFRSPYPQAQHSLPTGRPNRLFRTVRATSRGMVRILGTYNGYGALRVVATAPMSFANEIPGTDLLVKKHLSRRAFRVRPSEEISILHDEISLGIEHDGEVYWSNSHKLPKKEREPKLVRIRPQGGFRGLQVLISSGRADRFVATPLLTVVNEYSHAAHFVSSNEAVGSSDTVVVEAGGATALHMPVHALDEVLRKPSVVHFSVPTVTDMSGAIDLRANGMFALAVPHVDRKAASSSQSKRPRTRGKQYHIVGVDLEHDKSERCRLVRLRQKPRYGPALEVWNETPFSLYLGDDARRESPSCHVPSGGQAVPFAFSAIRPSKEKPMFYLGIDDGGGYSRYHSSALLEIPSAEHSHSESLEGRFKRHAGALWRRLRESDHTSGSERVTVGDYMVELEYYHHNGFTRKLRVKHADSEAPGGGGEPSRLKERRASSVGSGDEEAGEFSSDLEHITLHSFIPKVSLRVIGPEHELLSVTVDNCSVSCSSLGGRLHVTALVSDVIVKDLVASRWDPLFGRSDRSVAVRRALSSDGVREHGLDANEPLIFAQCVLKRPGTLANPTDIYIFDDFEVRLQALFTQVDVLFVRRVIKFARLLFGVQVVALLAEAKQALAESTPEGEGSLEALEARSTDTATSWKAPIYFKKAVFPDVSMRVKARAYGKRLDNPAMLAAAKVSLNPILTLISAKPLYITLPGRSVKHAIFLSGNLHSMLAKHYTSRLKTELQTLPGDVPRAFAYVIGDVLDEVVSAVVSTTQKVRTTRPLEQLASASRRGLKRIRPGAGSSTDSPGTERGSHYETAGHSSDDDDDGDYDDMDEDYDMDDEDDDDTMVTASDVDGSIVSAVQPIGRRL